MYRGTDFVKTRGHFQNLKNNRQYTELYSGIMRYHHNILKLLQQ